MERLVLVKPQKAHQQQAEEYISEFSVESLDFHGCGELENYLQEYGRWLVMMDNYSRGVDLPPGYVPGSQYFAFRISDNKLVGMVNIRHSLNDFLLRVGGHIGYSVRPSERRKGYATEILALAVQKCKEQGMNRILLTCDKNNIASSKTIINNNGVLEDEIFSDEENKTIQRYWITR